MNVELLEYLSLCGPSKALLASLIKAGNSQTAQFGHQQTIALDVNKGFEESGLEFYDGCLAIAELSQNNLIAPIDDCKPQVNLIVKNVAKWIEQEIAAKEIKVSRDYREIESLLLSLELSVRG